MLLIVEQGSSKVLSRIVLSGGNLNGEDLRAEMAELRGNRSSEAAFSRIT